MKESVVMKTTIVSVVALIAAFATPSLAQGPSYQGAYHPRAERPFVFERRNAAVVPAPDVPALQYTGREALIHAN
jgi:hypothetical protein